MVKDLLGDDVVKNREEVRTTLAHIVQHLYGPLSRSTKADELQKWFRDDPLFAMAVMNAMNEQIEECKGFLTSEEVA